MTQIRAIRVIRVPYYLSCMEETILSSLELGKGITDFGFMVITAAGYLVYSATIIFFFVKWFVRIINNIIDRQQRILDEILQLQKEQHGMIKELKNNQ